MIQDFFVWLLGPTLASLFGMVLFILGIPLAIVWIAVAYKR